MEIDLESRYRGETGHLAAEIQELPQLLHASQENKAREVEPIKGELGIKQLENEIQQLTKCSQVAQANYKDLSEQLEWAKESCDWSNSFVKLIDDLRTQ